MPNEFKGNLDKVKTQYRKLCLKWHPDKNRDKEAGSPTSSALVPIQSPIFTW